MLDYTPGQKIHGYKLLVKTDKTMNFTCSLFSGEKRQRSILSVYYFSAFMGRQPFIIVADLPIIRQILVKQFNKFVDRLVSFNTQHSICVHI